ncbi:MAG: UDP-3-O-(3-hydroxymyristoyl)glucosamine N-acyltransferase [Desulfovibrionaceae bacterium]|nr:UDP-3-O-(3-hydroxymyristoyl)glucosamine N-acyltransferase [Desulfovibrionaceae bacterium]MDD4951554.1 UDP-3-O-(3-hydroxymyristoyl)glucosamine N-acyltransferase [Desulfovibrionaceae bacterium]
MLLSELAARFGLTLKGGDKEIDGVNVLEKAGPSELSFFINPRYAHLLDSTEAGAVLVGEAHAALVPTALVSANVYLDLARLVSVFAKPKGDFSGISELAFVHDQAEVSDRATVYPFAYIGARCVLGPGVVVFPGCYVGEDCVLGEDCLLYPNVVLMSGTRLGRNVIIQPGAVIGGDGFGFAQGPAGHVKIPQVGVVEIGDDVEIGANSAVDRASLDVTRIGPGTKMDNLVQVAHNVRVGANCLLIAQCGIAGSSRLGDNVVVAGQAGIKDNVTLGDNVMVAAQAGVGKDLADGSLVGGTPAMEHMVFLKSSAALSRLPELIRRVGRLEKEIERLSGTAADGEEHG